ncbi:MAG: very-short-patch-repair endonuclease [Bacteroidia bacterium]
MGETLLWMRLQKKQVLGYQFNRQKPIGQYIVDFYCKKLQLVVEIDGGSHQFDEVMLNDVERQKVLESLGLQFLRFSEQQGRKEMDKVIWQIEGFIENFENEK